MSNIYKKIELEAPIIRKTKYGIYINSSTFENLGEILFKDAEVDKSYVGNLSIEVALIDPEKMTISGVLENDDIEMGEDD